jgi:hypothetical protein
MKGIVEWLASIGLSVYAQRFADNAIELSVLRDLTEQDLKDLGVLLGHRRKILRAIAELGGVTPPPTETAIESVRRDEAERRHLTVMICDLVGSTALSTRTLVLQEPATPCGAFTMLSSTMRIFVRRARPRMVGWSEYGLVTVTI